MKNRPLFFICNANTGVGFGHLSRCLYLAELLHRGIRPVFHGDFSDTAASLVQEKGYSLTQELPKNRGGCAIVDMMFDPEDMDYYDREFLEELRSKFAKIILISSATSVRPDLPVDIVIGHMLIGTRDQNNIFKLYAGLEYAPVDPHLQTKRTLCEIQEHIQRIFVGFGGSKNTKIIFYVLEAFDKMKFRGEIDLLLSPFHQALRDRVASYSISYQVNVHQGVPSLAPLLQDADVAIGSYGNITFESLCLGTPFVSVGVKPFQVRYAKKLEGQGLLISAGNAGRLVISRLCAILNFLNVSTRRRLCKHGQAAVDGRGIKRIADIIFKECIV